MERVVSMQCRLPAETHITHMPKQTDKILAEGLVKKGILSSQNVDECLKAVEGTSETLKSYLLQQGSVPEQKILEVLSEAFQIELVNLRNIFVDKNVLDKIPVRIAWYYKFMPIKIDEKTLTLATATPFDLKFQDEIRLHLGFEPRIVLATETDIVDALNKHYGLAADTITRLSKDPLQAKPAEDKSQWVEDLEQQTDDASVAKLVNEIMLEAYKKRATDIHLEPYRNKVRIRYRIDGVLSDANVPSSVKRFLPSIISRIKIMANLSIVEKRLPQDGSALVKTKEQDLDLRISTIPTPHGESMVIRILPTHVMLLDLEKLGLNRENLKKFRGLIKKPNGIILVTGPTGSGKTTTLYACLNEINAPQRKIITLEDPIEYEVEGITQIQVNSKVRLGFAEGLRSVLRHDPDIIMVGEIRDMETSEIAIRTALTGHLVFSTLHTNDAASGITRLVEMGLEPFLVASSIEAFVAQRLVRIICPQCKEEVTDVFPEIREEIEACVQTKGKQALKIYRGRGCDHCNRTGFYGRTAIYEVLTIDEDIRAAILEKKRADQIKILAMKKGMATLRQDGWRKVAAGVTTPEEVLNVTSRDDMSVVAVSTPAEIPGPVAEKPPVPAASPVETRTIKKEVLTVKDEYNSRIYPRVHEKVGIRYSIVRQDDKEPTRLLFDRVEHSSITRDISAGGLRFVSGYTLPVGTILDLKIQVDKSERSIDCLARVCRVEDDTLSAMFNLAVYYLDISSADRVRIANYVDSKLKKQL